MGPRFYDGQPVVCVWDVQEWEKWGFAQAGMPRPVKGVVYTVTHSVPEPIHGLLWGVVLAGYRPFAYLEMGFEPVTENRVQAIIAQAMDIMETEDA